ncbi:uncharacterized protein LOC135109041 [Scylla paramamosain]|uniref:uncharacterized protein LOC135109041 n=1 Tax=Scylla paramamosain TaxID=85552 RepID=UPI003083CE5B
MLGPIRTVFNAAQEAELVTHILSMEARFFKLTTRDVRYIAFHAARRNNVDHKFNKEVGLAGKDWLLGFHRRHPQLVIRTPKATSAARTKLFNPRNDGKFFDISSLAQADHFFFFFFLCTGFSMSMRQVLQRCKILILPPHCSHRMQPLDVSFMKLLDAYYVKAVETLLTNSPGRQVTVYKLSALFGEAYLQAAVPNTAISSFRKTGIFPLNSQVFGEADYLPAHPTDIPFEGEQEEEDLDEPVAQSIMALENESDLEAVEPENSSVLVPKVARRLFKPGSSPQDIIPLPKVATTVRKKRARPQGRPLVLTPSPYKTELESETQKKKEKDFAIPQKRRGREDKKKKELAMSASNKQPNKKTTKQKKAKQVKAGPSWSQDSDSYSEDGKSTECLYCNDTLGDSERRRVGLLCYLQTLGS